MKGVSKIYSSVMVGTVVLCFINLVACYPGLSSKDKDFVQETETLSQEKDSSNQILGKRIFDPIEAASNFGSFGKRYNPYSALGYANNPNLETADIADILKKVLAMAAARHGQYRRRSGAQQKRQFDPIGYGMFARFG